MSMLVVITTVGVSTLSQRAGEIGPVQPALTGTPQQGPLGPKGPKSAMMGGGPFSKKFTKIDILVFFASKMVVFPSSVSSHAALPSGKTSPEI